MKFPTYIILDVQKLNEKNNSEYWAFNYLNLLETSPHFYENFLLSTKLFRIKRAKTLKIDLKKFSLTYRSVNKNPKPIIKSINAGANRSLFYKNNKLWTLFNIYFLRKEIIYTKLKYSRVPQYDIVSGGLAMLFCGFLGFLICEKFGFELLDSGEFYLLFMYIVFTAFFLKLVLRMIDKSQNIFSWLNLNIFYKFYLNIIILIYLWIKANFDRLTKKYF